MTSTTTEIRPSRRSVLRGLGAAGLASLSVTTLQSRALPSYAGTGTGYLVGRGISDITGPAAENGMMGYSMPQQRSAGIHQRLRARAFVVVDRASGQRMAWCVVDQAMLPMAVHSEVLRRLDRRHPGLYTLANTSLTATHTHAAPGGCSRYFAYNLSIMGFQQQNFDAFVSGIVEAILAAHRDLAPGTIHVGRGLLENASVNRSKVAFDLNPASDKRYYPDAIDPRMTVLRLRQGRHDVGAISWFPTHGTSLPNTNLLISPDNKGYAAYQWEHDVRGVRYLADRPGFVAAFAQSNTGDMSPNLALEPGTGPTKDPFENTRIIGLRQSRKAREIFADANTPVRGSIRSRARYVDLSDVLVSGKYTPDGKPHRTAPGCIGASMMSGSTEDGPGLPIPEGTTDPTYPLYHQLEQQPIPDELRDEQQPKQIFFPTGPAGATPSVLPLQIIKLGQLYLLCGPAEFTIVSGLRIRRSVAQEHGVPLENVVMQGYSNGFSQYVATPEEYMAQQYEGGSTLFGKHTLPAYQQEFVKLARGLADGTHLPDPGPAPDPATGSVDVAPKPGPDGLAPGASYGDVLVQPRTSYRRGATVRAEFVAGHPKHDLRRNRTYLLVERRVDGAWRPRLDDNDWDTRFGWERTNPVTGESKATVEWRIAPGTPPGVYRIRVFGGARDLTGTTTSYVGTSRSFRVS
jgi:neutral ceramidase